MLNKKKMTFGFTLLEILIALFIFMIVSVIMVKALHSVFTSQTRTEQHAKRLAELQIALLQLSNDFEQTVDRPISNAAEKPEGFIGTAHSITLVHGGFINPDGKRLHPTLERVQYELVSDKLVRTTWPVLDITSNTKTNKRTWLADITELQFAYLDDQKHFQSSWPPSSGQTSLPKAIRVSLSLKKWGKLTQLYIIPGQPIEKPK